MTYTFQPQGVCSRAMMVEVDEQGVIQEMQVLGGCNGNLQGISRLVKGMKAEDAIARLKGIDCGGKGSSSPVHFARAVEKDMAKGEKYRGDKREKSP